MAGFLRSEQTSRRQWLLFFIFGTAITFFFIATQHFPFGRGGPRHDPVPLSHLGLDETFLPPHHVLDFVKPVGIKIVGLVFFGRRSRIQMMRCFLERNLVENGGWLDEVHWVRNTDNQEDLTYLESILASNPRYKEIVLEGTGFEGYGYAWTHLEPGNLYVKIDDDVVWFADDTIPRIVTMKVQNPDYLLVSANMINSPLMGWVHYHMGAIHPYLPEVMDPDTLPPPFPPMSDSGKPPIPPTKRTSWKYTDYPQWTGPDDYLFMIDQEPPYPGHRWLRLPTNSSSNSAQLHRTPITEIEYKTWGTGLKSWAIAAQEHYSFLENLHDDRLGLYKFTAGNDPHALEHSHPWITDYQRLSINLIALYSDEILQHLPMDTVDEEWLTINLPRKIGKSVAVDTEALAVHFTFGPQPDVEMTDLLGRYWDYALENACLYHP